MTDANLAVEALVRLHRNSNESLHSIAARLGVAEIVEEPLPVDGVIGVDGQHRTVIRISSGSSRQRQRFTLGHEIGHLILQKTLRGAASCQGDPELEGACDAIAAELLMPASELIPFVRELGSPSPEKLVTTADRFGVSLAAAARRVHDDLKLWHRSVGLWLASQSPGQLWLVGKRALARRIPTFSAFKRALDSPGVVRTRESYWEGQTVRTACIEVLHLGNGYLLGMVAALDR